MKRNKKSAAVDTAAGRVQVAYWPDSKKFGQAAEAVRDKVDPTLQQVADRVGPLAQQARKSGAHYAHNALEKVTPVLDEAWEKVTPAVESARDKVQGDLLPKLNELLAEAADHPAAKEASKRGRATAAALRGELEVPKKRNRVGKVLAAVAIFAAIGGAVAYALRKFLDNRDAEWEAPAPSAYGSSTTPKRAEKSPWAASSDAVKSADSSAPSRAKSDSTVTTPPAQAGGSAATPTPGTSSQSTTSVPSSSSVTTSSPSGTKAGGDKLASDKHSSDTGADDKGDKATPATVAGATGAATTSGSGTSVTGAADDATERRSYGAGSYVGTKPPAGFTIKGNERSMKYHTSDSPAYERTISDVWFNSEEAAEANGFSKAQR
ncbi:MAG: hypothetical protein L0G99_13710 [Propionibacteriales bacterium]|nr:hypothetical protein [Propionibacteriales bacterium]